MCVNYVRACVQTGSVASGIPQFRLPFFDIENEDEKFTFFEAVVELWPGLMIVPLVSILSTVSVAKAFSKYTSRIRSAGRRRNGNTIPVLRRRRDEIIRE